MLGLEVVNDLLDVTNRDRVDAGEGLVEQNELGVGRQGAGNLHAAALTTGQAHAEAVGDMVDVELLQQVFQLRLASGAIKVFARLEDGHDVVGHRQLAEDRCLLRQIADAGARAAVHGLMADVEIIDQHAALIGAHQADDHVETGGLAGAIGTEQADDLAAFDAQADVTHDLAALVAFRQVLGFENGHYCC